MDLIQSIGAAISSTATAVLPVAVFLFLFHAVVIGGRIPNIKRLIAGFGFVVAGLSLFLLGLELGLFPLGRMMAEQLTSEALLPVDPAVAEWHDYHWVYVFAFAVAFGTTVAEPALLAVAIKANDVSGGAIHVWGLRVAVALGVAVGVTIGCLRIVTGMPIHWFIVAGYLVVVIQTVFSPRLIVPLAYDSGGVSTSTVTVPVIAALGLGLSEAVPGRDPLMDGFGLIAFACLFPIISVLGYAQLTAIYSARLARSDAKRAATVDELED